MIGFDLRHEIAQTIDPNAYGDPYAEFEIANMWVARTVAVNKADAILSLIAAQQEQPK